MADHDIKNAVRDIECPVFENPAFTTPRHWKTQR